MIHVEIDRLPPVSTVLPRWVYFYLTAFLTECGLMAMWLAEPIFALDQLHASELALGVLGMGNGGGYALLAIAAGWLSDRTGRRRWMLLGTASQIAIALALPHAGRLGLFIPLAAMHTTLLAFFWPPFMSLFSETTPHEQLSSALSHYNISWCSGGVVGSALSGWLYDRLGPAAPFYFGAVVVTLSLIIQLVGRPGPVLPHPPAAALDRPRVIRLMQQAWLVLIGNFFVVSLLMYLFPKLAILPHFHMGATMITTLHGLRMGAMMLTFALMGMTVRWHFRQWPVNLCFGLMLAMMVLVALTPAAWLFILPFTVFGITTGIAYGLSAYYSMLSPVGRGAVVGIHETFLASGTMIGPIFGGLVIWATGLPAAPFLAGLVPLALLWFICARRARLLPPQKKTSVPGS